MIKNWFVECRNMSRNSHLQSLYPSLSQEISVIYSRPAILQSLHLSLFITTPSEVMVWKVRNVNCHSPFTVFSRLFSSKWKGSADSPKCDCNPPPRDFLRFGVFDFPSVARDLVPRPEGEFACFPTRDCVLLCRSSLFGFTSAILVPKYLTEVFGLEL